MYGLQISYQKSEVLMMGGTIEEENSVVEMLNCKIGCLPLAFLGLIVHNRHMRLVHIWLMFTKK
jgi:uncharacterized membrane protein